jgi:hypothetical protein
MNGDLHKEIKAAGLANAAKLKARTVCRYDKAGERQQLTD